MWTDEQIQYLMDAIAQVELVVRVGVWFGIAAFGFLMYRAYVGRNWRIDGR